MSESIAHTDRRDTLKRVLVELTFPPSLRVARDVCEFQAALGGEYVYTAVAGKPFAPVSCAGYQFSNASTRVEIRLFEDSLTIMTSDYQGFSWFQEMVLGLAEHAERIFSLNYLKRVGLLYENIFFFLPKEGKYPLAHTLFPHLNFEHPDVAEQKRFNLNIESARPGGGLNIRSSFSTEKVKEGELAGTQYGIYLLDLDSFHQGDDFGIGYLAESLSLLHGEIKIAYNRHIRHENDRKRAT